MEVEVIVGFVAIVYLIQAVLVGVLAENKGYHGVFAAFISLFTGCIPSLIYYAGMPMTADKQFETRRKLIQIAKKLHKAHPEGSEFFVDLAHL